MVFEAKNDTLTKIITGVMALVAVFGLVVPVVTDNEIYFVSLPVGAILAIVLLISWCFKPKSYEITDAGLLIHRPAGIVKIGRSRISGVAEVEPKTIRFAIRTFGIGGVFGYFGSFYTSYYGSMTWYVTDIKKPVLLITNDKKKILVSPGDKETFIGEVKKWVD